MILYFAGVPGGGWEIRERELNNFWVKRLFSYYWILKEKITMKNKVDLFLDSGAFSAWSQGKEIKIEDYITFIKENEKYIDLYANLDVIGDAGATWKNQMIMEAAGLHPLPVFHYGENIKWLERYLNKGYDYISLGGMVPITTQALIHWLDFLFSNYLTDKKGLPITKVHGFGLTSFKLMMRYPWFSVDSTSWVVTGRLGSIYVPRLKNNKWYYGEDSWKISVSNRSPNQKEAGKHFSTLNKIEKQIILKYITEKGYVMGESEFVEMPKDYKPQTENERWAEKEDKSKSTRLLEKYLEPGICNKYQLRDELNIMYFMDLEKQMPKYPWPFVAKQMKGFI